jgi:hypothetical protein
VSKTRCVQSFKKDFAAFIAAFVLIFPAAFAPIFSTVLIFAVAAFSAVPVSVFIFTE